METKFDMYLTDYAPDRPEVRAVESAYRKAFGRLPPASGSDQERYQDMVSALSADMAIEVAAPAV